MRIREWEKIFQDSLEKTNLYESFVDTTLPSVKATLAFEEKFRGRKIGKLRRWLIIKLYEYQLKHPRIKRDLLADKK